MVNEPDVAPNLCFPGKAEVAEMVAEISGKKMAAVEDLVAAIRCSKIEGRVREKLNYIGYGSCTAATLAFGGPSECRYACVGAGECAESCPFDAIAMVNGFPVVNADLCVACGACVRVCPKKIIELIPAKARVWVPCSTRDPGKVAKQICEAGCISCKMCVKACPAKAVALEENVVKIDYEKCIEFGPECGMICIEKCPRDIFRSYLGSEASVQQTAVAGG